MSITPGSLDITIRRGSTFDVTYTYRNASNALIDLSGYSAKLQVKATRELSGTPLLSIASGSGITLGGAAGTIRVVITDEQSTTLTKGSHYYDLVLTDSGGAANAILAGRAFVEEGVSA